MSDEEWRAVIETNLSGAFYVCRQFLPGFLAQRFGRIILIASLGTTGVSGQANYCASKGRPARAVRDACEGVRPQGHHVERGVARLLRDRHDARRDVGRQSRVLV